MQKDDRYYTFLFTHSSRSNIYIRRLEVSKKWLHTCAASAVLSGVIATAGIVGMKAEGLSLADRDLKSDKNISLAQTSLSHQVNPVEENIPAAETVPANSLTFNSGGPGTPFRLTNAESASIEDELEARLNAIERTSNPEFLPTIWAHQGKINNEFGFRRNPFGGRSYEFHPGMDIDGEKGDIVLSPANGIVTKAGWNAGYGNLIEIDHGNGLKTRYGHLSKVDVTEGDAVQRGQEIGLVGSTGRSTGPHLHYELRLDEKAVNPRRFLPPEAN